MDYMYMYNITYYWVGTGKTMHIYNVHVLLQQEISHGTDTIFECVTRDTA